MVFKIPIQDLPLALTHDLFTSWAFVWIQWLVHNIDPFPLLWIPHCLLMSLNVRNSIGTRWKIYSRQHPLSTYLIAILYTFPGGILATALLAQPVMSFMLNTTFVASMTVCWYLVFYSPWDLMTRLLQGPYVVAVLAIFQDVLRMQLVLAGVTQMHGLHPKAFLYPVAFAFAKSTGFLFFKFTENAIRFGFDRALTMPNPSSKVCLMSAVVLTLQQLGYYPAVFTLEAVYTLCTLTMVALRIPMIWDWTFDPFKRFESMFCTVVFGSDEDIPLMKVADPDRDQALDAGCENISDTEIELEIARNRRNEENGKNSPVKKENSPTKKNDATSNGGVNNKQNNKNALNGSANGGVKKRKGGKKKNN